MKNPMRLSIFTESGELFKYFREKPPVISVGGHDFLCTGVHTKHLSIEADFTEVTRVKVVWTGEGLPPVGVECEVDGNAFHDSGGGGLPISGGGGGSMGGISWVKCTVIAHEEVNGALAAIVNSGRKIGWAYSSTKFRPIRTPEQIAAEKRDIEIQALADELAGYDDELSTRDRHRAMATYLIDQGYGKKVAP